MKRSSLTPLSRLPRSTKKLRAATSRRPAVAPGGVGFTPALSTSTPRPASRTATARNPVVAARVARASYFNAFCAFLHTPAQ